jgi:F-type H+-transporting ATPase subunit gamma
MSTLQTLRQRRETVKATQKMMSAMKMVSASKLKQLSNVFIHIKAQQDRLEDVVKCLEFEDGQLPSYTRNNPKQPALWLVLGANRGLCGHFHTQLLRALKQHVASQKSAPLLYVFGDRLAAQMKARGYDIYEKAPMVKTLCPQKLGQLFQEIIGLHTSKKVGSISILSTHFQNALVQEVRLLSLRDLFQPLLENNLGNPKFECHVEPTRAVFLAHFFKTYGAFALYRLFAESILSEEGCRMTAMDGATRNSDDILQEIELMYNRQRQAVITKELIEVVSGAQALC